MLRFRAVRRYLFRQDGAVVASSKPVRAQGELFDVPLGGTGAEPVLMALKPEFYDLIWAGSRHMSSAAGSSRTVPFAGLCT
jgi:hypothetical protein